MRLVFLITLLCAPAGAGEDWKRLEREVQQLRRTPGKRSVKLALAKRVAREGSTRSALLLCQLVVDSLDRSRKIDKQLAKTRRAFERIDKSLRRKLGKDATPLALESRSKWRNARDELRAQERLARTETFLRSEIGGLIGKLRDNEAITVLVQRTDPRVQGAYASAALRFGVLTALLDGPGDAMADTILGMIADEDLPLGRLLALDWISARRIRKGIDAAIVCLRAPQDLVVRHAVAALVALDDPRCVGPLVAARVKAKGLAADELELALYRFTGKKFFGPGADISWKMWWKEHGAAYRAAPPTRRHTNAAERKGKIDFYGVTTRSKRIVFVVDRSGSMQDAGRFGIAIKQLTRSINALPKDGRFALVFFSSKVHRWPAAGEMAPATKQRKQQALAWIDQQHPSGATFMFEAMRRALRFSGIDWGTKTITPNGADTMFLLSDGSPSDPSGHPLDEPAIEEGMKRFFSARYWSRMVVHTIGVGPGHHRAVLKKIASESGGTYRGVDDS